MARFISIPDHVLPPVPDEKWAFGGLELSDGRDWDVAPPNMARLRYNPTTDQLEHSVNGGAYVQFTHGLVGPLAFGSVNPFGATQNTVLQSDGSTAGGIWRAQVSLGTNPATAGWFRASNGVALATKDGAGVHRALAGTYGMSGLFIGDDNADLWIRGNPVAVDAAFKCLQAQFTEHKDLSNVDTPYAILADDPALFLCSTHGGVLTVTLPAVGNNAGRVISIVDWHGDAAANNITIAAQGGETVNGAASIAITTAFGGCSLFCDGIVWRTQLATV